MRIQGRWQDVSLAGCLSACLSANVVSRFVLESVPDVLKELQRREKDTNDDISSLNKKIKVNRCPVAMCLCWTTG